MREATIAAARDLFGNCSFEEIQVTNAWAAGAVGGVYVSNCNTVPGGVYPGCYKIVAKHSNKNAQPFGTGNNSAIAQNSSNGANNQIFKIENASSLGPQGLSCPSCYRIISQDSYKFLRYGSTSSAGTPIIQAFWNTTNPYNYAWRFLPNSDNTFSITPGGPTNNLRMDVSGNSQSDGAVFQLWDSHGGDNQRFYLQSAACPVVAPPPSTCNFNVSATTSSTNVACGGSANLTVNCTGDCANVQYQWSGSGLNSTTQSTTVTLTTTGTYQYSITASKAGCQSQQATVDVSVSASTVCGGGFVACPSGNFAGFLDVADCNTFAGWALDHSNYGRTVDVDILVDGNKVATVAANQNRSDLGAAFGTAAAIPHGWSYSVPASASWRNGQNHTITARICGTTIDLSNSPKTVNCTGGSGGCTPPASPSISANVTSINAGQSATLSASGCSGTVNWNNGASGSPTTVSPTTTTTYTATCTVSGCVSANSNAVTVTVLSIGVNCAGGNFGSSFDDAGCSVFNGWALDHSNYGRTVQVEIRVDGVLIATVPANQSRPDLVPAFGTPAAEFHGWWYYPPANASWRNGQNHTVTTRICGATNDMNGSPKTVNCTGGSGGCTPPAAPTISASPSSVSSGGSATLSASGCSGGTVNWSNGASGSSTTVSPTSTASYTATCTVSGCMSANSNTATVTVTSGGGCAGGNFKGHFDSGNCGGFNGWALDMNDYGRTVQVELRVDGVLVATVPANQSRADLVSAFGTPAAEFHGWWYYPPAGASWRNGIKTVSARICGATADLYNSPKTVNFTNCRVGVIDDVAKEAFAGIGPSSHGEGFPNDGNDLILSPNPTEGELRYRLWLPENTTIGIEICDILGQTVLRDYQANQSGQLDKSLNMSHLSAGVYLFNLQTDKKRYTKKVLVVR